MHNTFNSGKKPGTRELCQLPKQWVEITGGLAGIQEAEYMKEREEQEKWQKSKKKTNRRVETCWKKRRKISTFIIADAKPSGLYFMCAENYLDQSAPAY